MASRRTLEQLPARVLKFLHGLGTKPEIRAAAEEVGFDDAAYDEGWRLLRAVCDRPRPTGVTAVEARAAAREVTAWSKKNRARILASVRRVNPELATMLAEGGRGDPIAWVATLLERIDMFDPSHPVLEILAVRRTLDVAERQRLRLLVNHTHSTVLAEPADESLHVLQLREWHTQWSARLRTATSQGTHRVALGLARRRARARTG